MTVGEIAMVTITISKLDEQHFEVAIQAHSPTTHCVTVTPDYAAKLTQGKFSTEELVNRSFDFLLARESNTSILRSFDLALISRYFPEYEGTINHS